MAGRNFYHIYDYYAIINLIITTRETGGLLWPYKGLSPVVAS